MQDVILSYTQRNSTLNFLLIKSYENLVHQVRMDHAIRLPATKQQPLV